MNKALAWVVKSSANKEKLSATLKNLVPLLLLLGVDQANISVLQEGVVGLVVGVGMVVTALGTLWALARKVWRTLNGTNLAV